MTRRELVLAALHHQETPVIPYHIDFTQQAKAVWDAFPKAEDLSKGACLHGGQFWGWPSELSGRPGFFEDAFGVVWNRNGADKDIGVIDTPVITQPDMGQYRQPVLDEKRLREELQRLTDSREDKFFYYGIGFSMFERAWSYCGMEDVLVYMVTEPEFLHQLLDAICEFDLKVMDIALEYPLDGFYFGDDWGQQKGLIMGPEWWRTFIKPRMKRLYRKAKEHGKLVLQHSCGDIEEIFEDLIEIGLDCYQTFQPEIYNVPDIKARYGTRLSFWGGISTQQLLPCASPEQVAAETRRIMDIMAVGGGYIAAPTHAVTQDIPPENLQAILEIFAHQ